MRRGEMADAPMSERTVVSQKLVAKFIYQLTFTIQHLSWLFDK
ncbi:MAG: hypothetical protein AAB336_05480 [Acidobacteriota bacterium]